MPIASPNGPRAATGDSASGEHDSEDFPSALSPRQNAPASRAWEPLATALSSRPCCQRPAASPASRPPNAAAYLQIHRGPHRPCAHARSLLPGRPPGAPLAMPIRPAAGKTLSSASGACAALPVIPAARQWAPLFVFSPAASRPGLRAKAK